MGNSVVNTGAGSPEERDQFLDFLRRNRPLYKEGDERPYTYYSDMLMVPEEIEDTFGMQQETLPRADIFIRSSQRVPVWRILVLRSLRWLLMMVARLESCPRS